MFREIVLIDYKRPLAERAAARKSVGPYRWRPGKPGEGRGFYTSNGRFECASHGSSIRLRLEDANDHITGRLRHTRGYYCDRDGDGDTLQPLIARLPRGRGFLAGWTMGEGMAACVDGTLWADATDAAQEAHRLAERDADASREGQEEEEAERERQDAEEEARAEIADDAERMVEARPDLYAS